MCVYVTTGSINCSAVTWIVAISSSRNAKYRSCLFCTDKYDLSCKNITLHNSRTSIHTPPDGCLKHCNLACLMYGCWGVCWRTSDNSNPSYKPRYVETKEMRNAELTCYVVRWKTSSLPVSECMCAACHWRHLWCAQSQASSAMLVRSALFWHIAQRRMVTPYWRFGHLQMSITVEPWRLDR